jgi:hypothetical protein
MFRERAVGKMIVSPVLCTFSTNTQTRSLTWCVHRISHLDINPDRTFRASLIARTHPSRGITHRAVSSIARYSHRAASSLRGIIHRAASSSRGFVIVRHRHRAVSSLCGIIHRTVSSSRGILHRAASSLCGIIHRTVSSSRGIIHRAASRGILHRAALFIAWHIPSLLGLPLCNELDMNCLAINIECASCICKLSI